MKRFLSRVGFLTIVAMLCLSIGASADTAVNPNVNVSTEAPPSPVNNGGTTPDGIGTPPSSAVWDITVKGQMDFGGSAAVSDLHTNNWFTGKSSYNIYIKNSHSQTLTVKLKKSNDLFATETYTIKPGYQLYVNPTGLQSSAKYQLVFYAPCDFYGYVR
ncbi:hypothetical protein [Bacillus infantis]|uniref:hypothetical protein n=1 Tax=Bacillus infantis TaxID=324767 RepID=UPI0021550FC2|nr:hypothetical protein [Bacillus infantis]MCR6609474.1 hypothetical protein [Bacillus infantis]